MSDQFAMPSIHVGWAAVVSFGIVLPPQPMAVILLHLALTMMAGPRPATTGGWMGSSRSCCRVQVRSTAVLVRSWISRERGIIRALSSRLNRDVDAVDAVELARHRDPKPSMPIR